MEAEQFKSQHADPVRKWHIIDSGFAGSTQGFIENYSSSASAGKYLPDTHVNHFGKLFPGENFANEPGRVNNKPLNSIAELKA